MSSPSPASPMMKISLHDDEYDDESEETTRRAVGPSLSAQLLVEPVIIPASKGITTLGIAGIGITNTSTTTTPSSLALWEQPSAPQLPALHPLEATAVFVPQASALEVSRRLSDLLRRRSIEAVFECAAAKAKCRTADGVDFRIRLYRGRDAYAHGIIVEVQRRFGSSFGFYQDTVALLDAALDQPTADTSATTRIPLVPDDYQDDYQVDAAQSLAFVEKLVLAAAAEGGTTCYDKQYLGLQTLQSLTDATRIGTDTALAISKELLRKSSNNNNNKVFDTLLQLVDKQATTKEQEQDADEDSLYLQNMAMTALANAVVTLQGDIDIQLYQQQIRPILLKHLHQVEQSPRLAQLACMILEQVVRKNNNKNNKDDNKDDSAVVDESQLVTLLQEALAVGAARHAALEHHAKLCLDAILLYDVVDLSCRRRLSP